MKRFIHSNNNGFVVGSTTEKEKLSRGDIIAAIVIVLLGILFLIKLYSVVLLWIN
jgi:hypothetical protein